MDTKRIAKLETIPEAKLISDWNEFVPGPVPKFSFSSVPVINSLFYNPFKYKRGRRPEPKRKNNNLGVKKKVKNRGRTLAVHEQQLCPYHNPHPIDDPIVYPGDEPVMAITVDPISSSLTKKPPVSPSTQPSLVAVSIDEPEAIPDEELELEKLVESSDSELDEIVRFGSLCSVMIPETFLSCGISTADVMADNPVYHIDLGTLQDEETVVTGSKTINLNKLDTTIFYDDSPRAQMDGGAGVSVTNLVSILHNVRYFNSKFKSRVRMHGATSKEIITPHAVGYMRVRALVKQGYLDVKCYYSPHFSTTLLSQVSVIEATGHPKQYISQGMQLFFAPNEDVLDRDLKSNSIKLDSVDYNHDYGTCMLTCVHRKRHSQSLSVPGVIRSGLCFTQPLIVPSLDKDDPKATVLNSLEKALAEDSQFVEQVKVQSLKLIYEYMQEKHIELMSCLESLPEEYHSLPFHEYFAKNIPISALNKEAEAMLWHQRLIHCGPHSL